MTQVSMNSTNMKHHTYLSHPDHLLSTKDDPWTSGTHHSVINNSKWNPEKSVEPDREDWLTRLNDCVRAISGKSDVSNMFYRDLGWWWNNCKLPNAKMKPLSWSRPTAHTGSCKDVSRAVACHIRHLLKCSILPPWVGKIPFTNLTIQLFSNTFGISFFYFYLFCISASTLSWCSALVFEGECWNYHSI